jgi:CHASE2 domain-containing sensor protein
MWQDLFFASSGVIFSLMLIPQLVDAYHGKGMNIITASLTAGLLFFQCYAYFTLNMFFAAIPITAIIWAAIAYFSMTRTEDMVLGFNDRKTIIKMDTPVSKIFRMDWTSIGIGLLIMLAIIGAVYIKFFYVS